MDAQKQWECLEIEVLTRRKKVSDGAGLNLIRRATENCSWLMAITQRLNVTELSREEFQDNILLWYGIIPLNLPTDCDGYGKNFSVPHALSFSKGGLVLSRHNDAAKEWGALSALSLNLPCISYEPKVNSRTV